MAHAEAKFDQVFAPSVNGPAAEHIEMLRRHGVEIPEERLGPDCPPELQHIMEWYAELRAFDRQGMSGVHQLTWSDVDAWARRMGENPRPTEWRLLMQLDGRYRRAAEKNKPKDKGTPPRGSKSRRQR